MSRTRSAVWLACCLCATAAAGGQLSEAERAKAEEAQAQLAEATTSLNAACGTDIAVRADWGSFAGRLERTSLTDTCVEPLQAVSLACGLDDVGKQAAKSIKKITCAFSGPGKRALTFTGGVLAYTVDLEGSNTWDFIRESNERLFNLPAKRALAESKQKWVELVKALNEECGRTYTTTVAWDSFPPELSVKYGISDGCAPPLNALVSLCRMDEVGKAAAKELSSITCTWGGPGKRTITVQKDVLAWGVDFEAGNAEYVALQFLDQHFSLAARRNPESPKQVAATDSAGKGAAPNAKPLPAGMEGVERVAAPNDGSPGVTPGYRAKVMLEINGIWGRIELSVNGEKVGTEHFDYKGVGCRAQAEHLILPTGCLTKVEGKIPDGVYGVMNEWSKPDNIKAVIPYKGGSRNGLFRVYRGASQVDSAEWSLYASVPYVNGKRSGLSRDYAYPGKGRVPKRVVADERADWAYGYKDDLLDGVAFSASSDGWFEGSNRNGKLHGPQTGYWGTGAVATKSVFRDGEVVEPLTYFDKKGKVIDAKRFRLIRDGFDRYADTGSSSAEPVDRGDRKAGLGKTPKGGVCRRDDECSKGLRCVKDGPSSQSSGHCKH